MSDAGDGQPTKAAAYSSNSLTTETGAPVVADTTSASGVNVASADGTDKFLATTVSGTAPVAAAAESTCNYFIAPTGSDSGAGTLASPWKTIRYASAKLTAGATLCARGGTYYGQGGLIWKSSGTATAPVTLKNYPGEKPVFDGQWGETGTDGNFLVFSNNSHVVVDGITIQHFADQYGNGTIDLYNGQGPVDDITIQNTTMLDNGSHPAQDHHIYIAAGVTNVTIRNNTLIRAAGSAIQSYHGPATTGLKIYNNVLIGGKLNCSQSTKNYCSTSATQHWGLMISDAQDTQIYNNTIYGMQTGIEFNYGTLTKGPFTVKNNLIANSTTSGIRVTSAYSPYYKSDYNGFSGNSTDINWNGTNMTVAQFATSTTNERNAVKATPMFVNAAAGDFHLNAGSPMINTGTSMTMFNTDKDGVARPAGYFDIGAYEGIDTTAPAPAPAPTPTPEPTPTPTPTPEPTPTPTPTPEPTPTPTPTPEPTPTPTPTPTPAPAPTACNYYIAPTGSDSGAGTLASPWKTIQYASAKLTAGKTLCARGGTYYGQAGLIWKSSGTATAPVTLRNYPGEKPVFDGQWGDTGTSGNFLVFSNNSHVVVDGITVQRFADQYGNGTINLNNGQGPVDNITIQNSTLMDNGSNANQDHHVNIGSGVTNVTIRNNTFIRAAGSAIQSYGAAAARGIKIYNNVMIGGKLNCSLSKSNACSTSATQHWGLMIADAQDTQIYNNTIYGMQTGIEFNYGTFTKGPFTVKNNIIANSTSAGIRVGSAYAPYVTSDYNGFSGNSSDINWKGANMTVAQFAASTTNERHAIKANPMFVNAAAGDLHLNSGSPMINKALSTTLLNTDKDGVARPLGYYDIGAYEKK